MLENQKTFLEQPKFVIHEASDQKVEFVGLVKDEPLEIREELLPDIKVESNSDFFDASEQWKKEDSRARKKSQISKKDRKLRAFRREYNDLIRSSQIVDFICRKCPEPQEFEDFVKLQQHSKMTHGEPHVWSCCNRDWRKLKELADHVKEHLQGPRWQCDECKMSFETGRQWRQHWTETHKTCKLCGVSDLTVGKFFLHAQRHFLSKEPGKLAKYECDWCQRSFSERHSLRNHFWFAHLQYNVVVCDKCGRHCTSQGALETHIKHVHATSREGKFFRCWDPSFTLLLSSVQKIPCQLCGMMIRNIKSIMDDHHKRKHLAIPTPCPICKRVLKSKLLVRGHIKRQHGEDKFNCKFCDMKFKTKIRHDEHTACHTNTFLYFCEFCSEGFKSRGNYSGHMRRRHPVEYEQRKQENIAKKFK